MDMTAVFKIDSRIVYARRESALRVVFLEESNHEFISFTGAAAEGIPLFDGKKSLSSIKDELDKIMKAKGSQEDFEKLVNFLIEKKIIVKT